MSSDAAVLRADVMQLAAQLSVKPLTTESAVEWRARFAELPVAERDQAAAELSAVGANIEGLAPPDADLLLAQVIYIVQGMVGGNEKAPELFRATGAKKAVELSRDTAGEAPPQAPDNEVWK